MSTLPANTVVPLYAGFWRRGAASFLDGLILIALLIVPVAVLQTMLHAPLLLFVLEVVVCAAYYAIQHASAAQATIGKRAFGIKVTGLAGERISLGRAVGRYFAYFLAALLLYIGLLMAAFTGRKQGLHDMMCGTLVVRSDADPQQIEAGGGTMPVTAGVWVFIVVLIVLPVFGGILAGISIPAYHDYTVRAKVAQALTAVEMVKREVEDAHQQNRDLPVGDRPLGTPSAESAQVTEKGEIIVTLAHDVVPNGRVHFEPVDEGGRVRWRCYGEGVSPRYLPQACR